MNFSLETFTMMDFNYFDAVIGSIVIILGIKGFVNGFIKEVFGLAGLVGGVYFASRLSDKAASFIEANLIQLDNVSLLELLGFFAILIIIWSGVTMLGVIISKLTAASGLGFINRLLGLVVGAGKYFIIFALIITALSNVSLIRGKLQKYVQDSQLYPYLKETGAYLINLDPKTFDLIKTDEQDKTKKSNALPTKSDTNTTNENNNTGK